MEYQKITNLLGDIPDKVPRCITKIWVEVYDKSGDADNRYKPSKQIRFRASLLQSDLCDYSDAYIVVKGKITVTRQNNNAYDKKLAFKNNARFISCISKINSALIENAEDLDIVMSMYNLLEYSKSYSKTSGSLWNYYRDELNIGLGGDDSNIVYSIKDSKSSDYKTSITGKLGNNNLEKEGVETAVPLKQLSNFCRTLDMPLINCEVSLTLRWSKNCVITSKPYRRAVPAQGGNPTVAGINNPKLSKIKVTKLYIPVVTLSTRHGNILLEQLKTRFKRTIKWNKCILEMSNQTKNNNLNYLIDPTFTKANRSFVLSFENENDTTSFSN